MKLFAAALFIASLSGSVSAFSPVAPNPPTTSVLFAATNGVSAPSSDPVDKTLTGIDAGAPHDVFEPTEGENPALTRNNNDEVWVTQVSYFKLTDDY